jgi:DNA-binding NtrC family response regulator
VVGLDPESDSLYAGLYPRDFAPTVSRLIEQFAGQNEVIVEEWHSLCAQHFGLHHAFSEQTFREYAVPLLRRGTGCAASGDIGAFVAFGRDLGMQLVTARIPFVAFINALTLLRKCYANVFAAHLSDLPEILHQTDNLHSFLVSVAADTYYQRHGGAAVPRADEAAAPRPSGERFCDMAGDSSPMQRVFEQIRRVAGLASPVLVLGETGTGKELVARAVHHCGPAANGPFIAVNCAALPRELVESELFGYVRGAFSGAVAEGLGLFRAAEGGTLFLDEITEMSPELQAKMLRVVQERKVRPVGSVAELPIDVRIIASSNRSPESALASGCLRADLYYRLSVSTIELPPLRDRREDVAALALHYLNELATRAGKPQPPGFSAAALQLLRARTWPGNVRELFNVVESAYALCPDGVIDVDALMPSPPHGGFQPAAELPELSPLKANECAVIAEALAAARGNKRLAAKQLGISRTQLYAKIAKYGLTDRRTSRGGSHAS